MAKLPEIQYQLVSSPRGGRPVGTAQAKRNFVNQAFQAVDNVAKAYTEDQINVTNAEHRQRVLDANQFIEENQALSREQLKQAGIYDELDVDPEMEVVPRHVWRTAYLQKQVDESRELATKGIQQPRARDAWSVEASKSDDILLAGSVRQSAADAWQYHVNDLENKRKLAIESGDWDRVEEIQNTKAFEDIYAQTPGMKDIHNQAVRKGRELDSFNTMMVAGQYDELKTMLLDPERDSELNSDEVRRMFFAADQKQIQEEAARNKARKAEQDANFMNTMAALSTGDATLADVNATRGRYDKAGYSQLVGFALSREQAAASGTSVMSQAVENGILMDLKLARAGVWNDAYEDLDDFKMSMMLEVTNSMSRIDNNGALIPGLSATRVNFLMNEIQGLEKVPYESTEYKNLAQQLKLRILRSEEGGLSFLSSYESATAMADALDSLHKYIDNNGIDADLEVWRANEMPRFLNQTAQAAFAGLSPDLKKVAVYSTNGRFEVDYDATRRELQSRMSRLRAEGRPTDRVERNLADLETYWREHGEDVNGQTN